MKTFRATLGFAVLLLLGATTLTACGPPTYLSDMRSIEVGAGCGCFSKGPAKVNGVTYNSSLSQVPGAFEYDLSRKYATFEATVGMRDDAASSITRSWRLLGDGVVLAQGSSPLGQSQTLSVKVTNVLRLRLEVVGGWTPSNYFVWGDARVSP